MKEGQKLTIDRKEDAKEGDVLTFDTVMYMHTTEGKPEVGTPVLPGHSIEAKVLGHTRGDKILVLKMKAKKRYMRHKGHKQDYTEVLISSIK